MKPLQIGKLKLKNPLVLAPMVDVTDLPYRLLCRKSGAALAFTEMIYVDAILHENSKTKNMMKTCKEDRPIGLQITGNSEEEFEKFVESKKWKDFDLIDLNCGCPSLRITGNEAGSYLLKNPEKIGAIVKILKKTKKPVTVKIRLGFKKNNVLKIAKEIEKAGADALTVHARLAVHGRDVPADWKWIKKVKEAVKIPVIGNGDVFSGEDARKMLEICDGVMIARGAIGDPGIFSRILESLLCPPNSIFVSKTNPAHPPENSLAKYLARPKFSQNYKKKIMQQSRPELRGDENVNILQNLGLFLEYLKLEKKYFGEEIDLGKVKYVGGKFLRGFDGAGRKREELMRCKSFEDIERLAEKNYLCLGVWPYSSLKSN